MTKVDNKIYANYGNKNAIELIKKTSATILDIGCGAGDNARTLKDKGNIVDGITLSLEEKKIAEIFCRKVYIYNLEQGLPTEILENNYDYIICSHVIEHIAFPDKLMVDIYNLSIKNNTRIIILLPNIMHYASRIKLISGKFNYTETGVMDYTHLRWYTYKSAQQYFRSKNFDIKNAKVDGLLPYHSLFQKFGSKSVTLLKKLLYWISPSLFGSELIFELEPLKNR